MLSCEFCQILKNSCFTEHLCTTAFEPIVKFVEKYMRRHLLFKILHRHLARVITMSSAEKQYEHLILMSTCLFNEMKVPFTAIFREKVKEETIKGGPSTSKKITRNTMKGL